MNFQDSFTENDVRRMALDCENPRTPSDQSSDRSLLLELAFSLEFRWNQEGIEAKWRFLWLSCYSMLQ